MAKDPAFLFYSQDFYTGVSTMNFEDRGKYITILCLMHQQGRLSEESISFIVGSVSVNLKSKFSVDENGLWYNKRLEFETEKRNKFTESRRNNGLLGGRGIKKNKASAKASAKHKDNLMENENVNEIKDLINNELQIFDNFRKEYLGTKRGNETEFKNFQKHSDWKLVLPKLLTSLNNQIANRKLKKQKNEFVPEWKNLQTWINNRCWEEVIDHIKQENKSIYSHYPEIK